MQFSIRAPRQPHGAAKGSAAMRAKADARWRRVLELSGKGVSFGAAVLATETTPAGLRKFLRKRCGSEAWPVAQPPA